VQQVLLALLVITLPFQFGRHFWPQYSYLFGLKVDYLSPTVYLQDILIVLLIFNRRKEFFFFLKKSLRLVAVYCLLLIGNICFSLNPLVAFFAWLRVTELILFGIFVAQNTKQTVFLLDKILPFLLIFESVLGVWQVVRESSAGGLFWFFGERSFNILTPGIARAVWQGKVFLRPYGTFSHPNSLSGFILLSLLLLFSKDKISLLDKVAIVSGLILIILGFSRVIWLALFLLCLGCLLYYLLFKSCHGQLKLNFRYLFLLLYLPLMFFLFSRTEVQSQSYLMRQQLARVALDSIRTHLLLGLGLNNFIINLGQNTAGWQWFYWLQPVHNIFLLAASETGLVGLAAFLFFLVLTVRRLFNCYIVTLLKKSKKQDSKIAIYQLSKLVGKKLFLLAALMVIMFTGLFDHYWLTLIQNQLLFTLFLGLSWGRQNAKITL